MAGKRGMGGKLEYTVDDGATYVPVANITKIRPFAQKADVLDVTAMDSPDSYREKIAGILDAGQCSFDLNYDDKEATHVFLLDQLGVTLGWRLSFPGVSPTVATFEGFVTAVPPEIPYDNKMTCSPVIEINGKPVITPGA